MELNGVHGPQRECANQELEWPRLTTETRHHATQELASEDQHDADADREARQEREGLRPKTLRIGLAVTSVRALRVQPESRASNRAVQSVDDAVEHAVGRTERRSQDP